MATAFHQVNNNAASVLASALTSGGLSAAVSTGEGAEFDSGKQYLTIGRNDPYPGEIVDVTSRSSDTFTLASRGADGTSASAHEAGDRVEALLVAAHITEIQDAINAIENGTVTLAQVKLGDDTGKLIFGNDSDIQFLYDEATDDRLEITDGTNVLAYLKDLGTTGLFGVTGRAEIPQIGVSADTDLLTLASNLLTVAGDLQVDGATNNAGAVFGTTGSTQSRYVKVNTRLASNCGFVLQSAGSDKWYLYRPGATTNFALGTTTEDIVIWTEAGAMSLKQGGSTDKVVVGGAVYVSTTAVGNVGAGEDDLMSASIAASTLGTNNMSLQFEMHFTTAANANNKTIKVKFGSTTLWDSGAVAANNQRVRVNGRIYRTGAATQIAVVEVMVSGGYTSTVATSSPTETLSGAITLKATGEATSDNDIQQLGMFVNWAPNNT